MKNTQKVLRILSLFCLSLLGLSTIVSAQPSDCPTMRILKKNEVMFADQTVCELQLFVPEGLEKKIIIKDENGNTVDEPTFEEDWILVRGLQPGAPFFFYTLDNCGEEKLLTTIGGPQAGQLSSEDATVEVSNELFKVLSSWTRQSNDVKLSTVLLGTAGSSVFERLQYLQNVIHDRAVLIPTGDIFTAGEFNAFSSRMDVTQFTTFEVTHTLVEIGPATPACKCAIVTMSMATPRDMDQSSQGQLGYNDVMTLNNPIGGSSVDYQMNIAPLGFSSPANYIAFEDWTGTQGYWAYNFKSLGAAKQFYIFGRCEGGVNNQGKVRDVKFSSSDSTIGEDGIPQEATTMNAFVTGITLSCVNPITELPSNCGCSRTYDITAHYETKLQTNASTLPGLFTKKAMAQAEDAAFLMELNGNTGASNYLQGKGRVAIKQASSNLNPTWVTEGGNLLHGIGQIIGAANSGSNSTLSGLFSGQSVNLGSSLANMINAGVITELGSGVQEITDQLVHYENIKTIQPNESFQYYLSSGSMVKVEGQFSWQSEAGVYSNAYLAIVVKNGGSGDCCNYRMTRWCSAAGWNAPKNKWLNLDLLGTWYYNKGAWFNLTNNLSGYPTLQYDMGRFYGPKPQGCTDPMGEQRASIKQEPLASTMGVATQEGNIWLIGNKNQSDCQYMIYDLSGRIIKTGNAKAEKEIIFNNAAKGMYLIKITSPEGNFSYKAVL